VHQGRQTVTCRPTDYTRIVTVVQHYVLSAVAGPSKLLVDPFNFEIFMGNDP